jgi:hypothetical protein
LAQKLEGQSQNKPNSNPKFCVLTIVLNRPIMTPNIFERSYYGIRTRQ